MGSEDDHVAREDDRWSALWIVVPAYNESLGLRRVLEELLEHYPNVVVVDDGSSDDTSDGTCGLGVWLLRHEVNCGQGAALQTGIEFALRRGAEVVVTFDADGQHAVEDIEALAGPVLRGEADITLGSRFLGHTVNMPRTRWIVLRLGVLFTRIVSRVRVTDTHNGLRAMSRETARRIRIINHRMAHASDILHQIDGLDLHYQEVPVTIRYTEESLAKGQGSLSGLRILGEFFLGRLTR